jgi:hypothetical protein
MGAVQGQVLGTVGGSLQNSTGWAQNKGTAQAGTRGEVATAKALDSLARTVGGPTVLHDLRIPIPGISANIDHIVVSGRRVLILDSKTWKPGIYWTLFGLTFRGRERFAAADKKTMLMAREAITKMLAQAGVRATVAKPLLVIWPSTARATLRLAFLRSPGAGAVSGDQFVRALPTIVGGNADPKVVAALLPLVIGTKSPRTATPATTAFAPGEL